MYKRQFVVLDNDESTNTQLCIDKSDILNHKHSLFGVSYSYHSLADWQNAKDLQDNVEKMGCSFLFLYEKEREHLCAPQVQETLSPVSYTHLDVYKRQLRNCL